MLFSRFVAKLLCQTIGILSDNKLLVGADYGSLNLRIGCGNLIVRTALATVTLCVEVDAHELHVTQNILAQLGRVLANTTGEDYEVDTTHLGSILAHELLDAVEVEP